MLQELLSKFKRTDQRVAIVGIGNDLNGDDAAGVLVARSLREHFSQKALSENPQAVPAGTGQPAGGYAGETLLIIDAGPSPESFTGPLRRFQPDLVILVDAAELSETPGTIRFFDWEAAQGMSGSTHTLPPSMLAEFLIKATGCQVLLIGIQPAQLDFDSGLSGEMQQAVDQLILALKDWLE